MMIEEKHKPVKISPNLYQIGTHDFPVYLSMGDDIMIIEGGTGTFFPLLVRQIKELGIAPEKIKYIALTHTHPDHIGAVPHLKKLWPHLQVIGSSGAAKSLKRLTEKKEALKEFLDTDHNIARIQIAKGEITEVPPELEHYDFHVDKVVEEGERINLGGGLVWRVYNTPGHAPCHIAMNDENDGILVIGDATGFYVAEKNAIWPNYFESLENYCHSIQKLATLPAEKLVLSHNGVVTTGSRAYFEKTMKATEAYHNEMLARVESGEDIEKIATEKARWVNSITDIQTYDVMYNMSKLLIKRSQLASKKHNLFTLPYA
jgi:glyoxylase-like metal-dependent hydrolase (beta-lactamase superfamily II)